MGKTAAKEIDNCIQIHTIHKNRLNSYASLLLITYIDKTQLINCNKDKIKRSLMTLNNNNNKI